MRDINSPSLISSDTPSTFLQPSNIDISGILSSKESWETILWIKVLSNSIFINENNFTFTLKLQWESFFVIWTYNIFTNKINKSKWVKNVEISSYTPNISWKKQQITNAADTILSSSRFNNHLITEDKVA